jgi:hypothetical protein
VAFEVLVGDSRIRMDRKEHRVIRESRDDGGVSRGMSRGEEEVEKRAKDTALGHQISPHGRWSTWYYTGPGSSGLQDTSVKADSAGLEARPSVYTAGRCATLYRTPSHTHHTYLLVLNYAENTLSEEYSTQS